MLSNYWKVWVKRGEINIYLLRFQLIWFILPFFAIAYSLMLAYFFRKIFRNPDKVYFLCIIPVLGGLFDYLENLGVIVMITAYPKFNPAIARGMNVFSISKSLFTTLFFALLAVLAITLAVKRLQNFSKTRS